jgi:phosphoribosylformylglycinamidine synthase PurS subunit
LLLLFVLIFVGALLAAPFSLRHSISALRHFSARGHIMKAHVWVMPKPTVLDPQGQTIHRALTGLGYAKIEDVRQGKFFVLSLDGLSREEATSQVERIARDVLANPVIEEFRFEILE